MNHPAGAAAGPVAGRLTATTIQCNKPYQQASDQKVTGGLQKAARGEKRDG